MVPGGLRLGAGVRREVGVIIKGQHEGSCGGGFTTHTGDKHTHTHAHIHMNTSKTGEICIGLVDCIHVNILVVILSYNFTKCYHQCKMDKAFSGTPCIISYNCM